MEQIDKNKENRIELIKVAQTLFQQYGFVKTTMDDIAKAARKSKTTLYQCFKNKEEVLEGVLEKEIKEVYSTVIKEISNGQCAADRLRIYMKTVLKETKKRIFLYALMRGELKSQLFLCTRIKKEMDTLEIEEVKSILRNGIVLGEFSVKHKEHIHAIAYYFTNATRGLLIQLIIDDDFDDDVNNDLNQDMLIDIFIKGLQS